MHATGNPVTFIDHNGKKYTSPIKITWRGRPSGAFAMTIDGGIAMWTGYSSALSAKAANQLIKANRRELDWIDRLEDNYKGI